MSKALTIFDSKKLAMPSHVQDAFADEKNINDRVTVPSLSYEGKVWTVSIDGEKTKMMKKDEDGEQSPIQTLRVVVLDYNKRRGRAYYEGNYDPAKAGAPLCWSDDGVKPDPAIKAPQCASCDKCPMSVKGSKTTDNGKAVAACSQHRMVVVAPLNKLEQPLRLKLAITSDWDKQNPEMEKKGWFAFNNYTDYLRTMGVNHTAAIVTKMRFDPETTYPKVIFSPDRWLEEDEVSTVVPIIKSADVASLLSGTWTPAGVDGVKVAKPEADDEDDEPAPKPKVIKKAVDLDDDDDEPAPKAKAKKVVEDDDDDVEIIPPKKAAKKAVAEVEDDDDEAPPPKAKAKKKAVADDEDEDEAPPPKAKAKAEPKGETKKAKGKGDEPQAGDTDVPSSVAGLLEEWDED